MAMAKYRHDRNDKNDCLKRAGDLESSKRALLPQQKKKQSNIRLSLGLIICEKANDSLEKLANSKRKGMGWVEALRLIPMPG